MTYNNYFKRAIVIIILQQAFLLQGCWNNPVVSGSSNAGNNINIGNPDKVHNEEKPVAKQNSNPMFESYVVLDGDEKKININNVSMALHENKKIEINNVSMALHENKKIEISNFSNILSEISSINIKEGKSKNDYSVIYRDKNDNIVNNDNYSIIRLEQNLNNSNEYNVINHLEESNNDLDFILKVKNEAGAQNWFLDAIQGKNKNHLEYSFILGGSKLYEVQTK